MTLLFKMKDTRLHYKGFMPKTTIHHKYLTLRHDNISIIYEKDTTDNMYNFKRLVMPSGRIDRDLLGRTSLIIIQDDFRRKEGIQGLMKILAEFRGEKRK